MKERGAIGRGLLVAAAVVFVAATTLFSAIWIYYAKWEPKAELGIRFAYEGAKGRLRVTEVEAGSAAERAGLRAGDVVTAINGRAMVSMTPYYDFVTRGNAGDKLEFAVAGAGGAEVQRVVAELTAAESGKRPRRKAGVVAELVDIYPIGFLVVSAAVLLLRVEDRNAWRLALIFAGFIALVPVIHIYGEVRGELRLFALVYKAFFLALAPAAFYFFFAVFPARSALERRAPWLKWVFVAVGLGVGATSAVWLFAVSDSSPMLGFLSQAGFEWEYTERGAVLASARGPMVYALLGITLAAYLLGVVSLVGNVVGADREARRKARVIFWGTILGLAPILLLTVAIFVTRRPFYDYPVAFWLPTILLSFLMPAAYAYAVVRHRVMEIPVLLRRSARYFLVQRGFLVVSVALCAGVLYGLAQIFRVYVQPQVADPVPLALAAGVSCGLVMLWAGAKTGKRVTSRIDRAFFRSAYDTRQILQELAEKSRGATNRAELAGLLAEQIGAALHPKSIGIFIESAGELRRADAGEAPAAAEVIPGNWRMLEQLAANPAPVDLTEMLLFTLRQRIDTLAMGAARLELESAGGMEGAVAVESAVEMPLAIAAIAPECLAPMVGRGGKLVGLVALGQRMSEEPYSSEDRRLLQLVAGQAAMAVENIQMAEQMAEQMKTEVRTKQEMEIARQVQARLFPQNPPEMRTLEYAGSCRQARAVGGDYYDFLDLGSGRVALLLADISGKGMSAALLMAHLQANLRGNSGRAHGDAPELLRWVNQMLFESTSPEHYATLFFAMYDDATRRLRYANCGHNAPVLFRGNGKHERLGATATVVGLIEEWECEMGEVEMEAGDTLVVFSDGVTEAMDELGQFYGDGRLVEMVERNKHLGAAELMAEIAEEVMRFSGREQEDDLTLVVARVR